MTRVFVSHASQDRTLIETELNPFLEAHGLTTWSSEKDIPVGSQWERTIRRGLEECDWFLLVMTPNSLASKWVALEVHWAMEERFDRFVPVLLRQCDISQWHLGIRQLQIIDLTVDRKAAEQRLLSVFGVHRSSDGANALAFVEEAQRNEFSASELSSNWDAALSLQPLLSPFQYFCYISERKVNQLIVQVPDDSREESLNDAVLVRRIAALMGQVAVKRAEGSGELHELEKELSRLQTIRNLGSFSFGIETQIDAIRKEAGLENVQSLVSKTRRLLRHLLDQQRVDSLTEAVRQGGVLGSSCYVFTGPHHVQDYAGPGMVIVSSHVGDYILRLYCSMKYFSDMLFERRSDGTLHAQPNSLNFAFFQEHRPFYSLITFLIVTSVQEKVILGSPICMILDSQRNMKL